MRKIIFIAFIIIGSVALIGSAVGFFYFSQTKKGDDIVKKSSVSTATKEASTDDSLFNESKTLPRLQGTAFWPSVDSLNEMQRQADLIIAGQAVKREPGRTVPDSTGTNYTPFTRTTFLAEEVIKGDMSKGQYVVVEQTGGKYIPTHRREDLKGSVGSLPPEANETPEDYAARVRELELERQNLPEAFWLEMEDDPIFIAGERALLFLRWEPIAGAYQFVPQGRYRIDANSKLAPMAPENPVSKTFIGKSVEDLTVAVQAAQK